MPYASPHFLICAGETSGEMHAAALARSLARECPRCTFSGMGGKLLADAGVELRVDAERHKVMGFAEVLLHLPFFFKAASDLVALTRKRNPAAVILVDNPGFNLRLAGLLKRKCPGVRIVYYIAPKAWAWNPGRAAALAREVDLLLCILPFEEEWFRSRGARARYVGNPSWDAVRACGGGEKLRAELGLGREEKLLALFPGSRRSELARLLPDLAAAVSGLPARVAVSVAPGWTRADLEQVHPLPAGAFAVEGRPLETMAASDAVLAKSGTTTLEAALLGKPMAAFYKVNPVSAFFARRLVKLRHFSLPNIVAGEEIVPEYFQEQVTAAALRREAERLLEDTTYREAMATRLMALRDRFGSASASDGAARAIAEFIR